MPYPLAVVPEKNCLNCNAPLLRRRFPSALEDATVFQRRKYCSLRCFGLHRYRDQYPLSKATYHARARRFRGPKCEACGTGKRLVAHHVDQNYTNNDPRNIQTLCKPCHDFWHSTQERVGMLTVGRMPALFPGIGESH